MNMLTVIILEAATQGPILKFYSALNYLKLKATYTASEHPWMYLLWTITVFTIYNLT